MTQFEPKSDMYGTDDAVYLYIVADDQNNGAINRQFGMHWISTITVPVGLAGLTGIQNSHTVYMYFPCPQNCGGFKL